MRVSSLLVLIVVFQSEPVVLGISQLFKKVQGMLYEDCFYFLSVQLIKVQVVCVFHEVIHETTKVQQ